MAWRNDDFDADTIERATQTYTYLLISYMQPHTGASMPGSLYKIYCLTAGHSHLMFCL